MVPSGALYTASMLTMIDLRHILPLTAIVSLVGCFAEDETVVQLEEIAAPLEMQRGGTLLAEFNPHVSTGVALYAQFLEVHGISLRAANDALDVWTPELALDEDTCSLQDPTLHDRADVRVRMFDVGTIAVHADDHFAALTGRRVPDLATLSGVVYGNESGFDLDEAFLPYLPDAQYTIEAPGGAHTGGFSVALRAPAYPVFDVISGSFVVDDAPIALHGADLAIAWNEIGDRDSIFIDVTSSRARLTCRVEDDGDFSIPATVLGKLGGEGPLTVTMRRADVVELPIDGIDRGQFVFAASNEVRVTR